jgi:hypothetical protein
LYCTYRIKRKIVKSRRVIRRLCIFLVRGGGGDHDTDDTKAENVKSFNNKCSYSLLLSAIYRVINTFQAIFYPFAKQKIAHT